MSELEMQNLLQNLLEEYMAVEYENEVSISVRSFKSDGVLTSDTGMVVVIDDGDYKSKFHVTIQKRWM